LSTDQVSARRIKETCSLKCGSRRALDSLSSTLKIMKIVFYTYTAHLIEVFSAGNNLIILGQGEFAK
jgi:hypothetical protein